MKKIIITDDLRFLLEEGESFLQRADLLIRNVASGREALALHQGEHADLIVVSRDDPAMDAVSFCAEVRSREETRMVSIIVVGRDGAEAERLLRAGANAFIMAPVTVPAFLDKTHELLHIAKREDYRAPISVVVEGQIGKRPFLCHSENISASGMLFETDRALLKGDVIFCSFILPDATRVKTGAEIMRVAARGSELDTQQYGIRFSGLAAEYRRAIEKYVARRSRG